MEENPSEADSGFQVTRDFDGVSVTGDGATVNVFSGTAGTLITAGEVNGSLVIGQDGGVRLDGRPVVPGAGVPAG